MKYSEIDPEKLKMTGNRILVRKKKPVKDDGMEKRASGLVVPKDMEGEEKGPDNIAEVVRTGPDVMIPQLKMNPNIDESFKKKLDAMGPAPYIIMQPYAGVGFPHSGYDYSIISEQEVLAVI